MCAPIIVELVDKEKFAEAEGFTNGLDEVFSTTAQFVGSGLLLFLSYSNLAFINAFTFLAAGLLYLSVGLRHTKENTPLAPTEVNDQNFFATMKSSYIQIKKASGLLSTVLVIALLNGALSAMGSLLPIIMAGHRSTMLISNYSFTLAVIGVVISVGSILGSAFGPQLFKKQSVFIMVMIAIILSIATTIAAFLTNIYAILPFYLLLAAIASTASLKMQQWLVTTIDQTILASSMGLLNTIIMATAPAMTMFSTTISGLTNVKYSLLVLLVIECISFIVSIKLNAKDKMNNVEIS